MNEEEHKLIKANIVEERAVQVYSYITFIKIPEHTR